MLVYLKRDNIDHNREFLYNTRVCSFGMPNDKYISGILESSAQKDKLKREFMRTFSEWKLKPEIGIIIKDDVPYKVVKEQIIEYLQNTPGEIFVSDIIRKLKFDLMTILKALKELHEEGIIEKLD